MREFIVGRSRRGRKRRLVIGDVHGCVRTLRTLLFDLLQVDRGDTIYFLGDLISKGPDSRGVLETVESLGTRVRDVVLLRGNHEADLLDLVADSPGKVAGFLRRTRNDNLITTADGDALDPRWLSLFERSRYYVTLDRALLVHAGFAFDGDAPFDDTDAMVRSRDGHYDAALAGGRRVFHGHVRHPLTHIISRLASGAPVIPLDNGIAYRPKRAGSRFPEHGNLCCFELDAETLHVQPNRDEAVDGDGSGARAFSVTFQPWDGGSGPGAG